MLKWSQLNCPGAPLVMELKILLVIEEALFAGGEAAVVVDQVQDDS